MSEAGVRFRGERAAQRPRKLRAQYLRRIPLPVLVAPAGSAVMITSRKMTLTARVKLGIVQRGPDFETMLHIDGPGVLQSLDPPIDKVTVNAAVTLADNGDSWTLDNGIVEATVAKRDGNLSTLSYHGIEILTRVRYWKQVDSGTAAQE
jgi:hypothetical protein